MTNQIIRKNKK